jgi:hypothetical protein
MTTTIQIEDSMTPIELGPDQQLPHLHFFFDQDKPIDAFEMFVQDTANTTDDDGGDEPCVGTSKSDLQTLLTRLDRKRTWDGSQHLREWYEMLAENMTIVLTKLPAGDRLMRTVRPHIQDGKKCMFISTAVQVVRPDVVGR